MRKAYLTVIFFMAVTGSMLGQVGQRSQLGSIQRYLFSPDLVMRNQDLLGLSEEQRSLLVQEVQKAQSAYTELNWSLEDEVQTLTALFEASENEESRILEQFDTVLDLERQVKRAHLVLALRMRNILDQDQLAKIDELRRKRVKNQRDRWSSLKKYRQQP